MGENGHIFLSYRSIESDFALRLAADLKNAGVRLWMDRLDFGIKVGHDWVQKLQEAVNNCAGLISVVSPEYVTAKYCRRELKRADTLERPIFPVLLETVRKESWPLEIQEKEYVDFREWHIDSTYRQRLDELLTVLRKQNPAHFGDVPDHETRYLIELISMLEANRGVLEYVDLPGQASIAEYQRPNLQADTGWADEFSLLVDFRPKKGIDFESSKIQKVPLTNIGEATENYPRFVLTGKPGTGKTTTLRRLALDVARRRLANPHSAPLPLFLYLSRWRDQDTPSDLIRTHWPFSSDPLPLLPSGDVVLYMDGLNEMGPMGKARADELRHWLIGSSAPAKVVISCRLDDYTEDLDLRLPTVLLAEMDLARIERFAINYLGEARAKRFLSSVYPKQPVTQKVGRSLVALARNPYLLAALIYIYLNVPAHGVPRNTGQLFHALVKALWAREQQRRTSGWVPFENMQTALSHLAFAMIDGDMATSVPQQLAIEHIGNATLLCAARSANLLTNRDDQVSFYHQLIQEYFAAVYMINEQIDPGKFLEVDQYESTFKYWQVMGGKWKHVVIAWSGLVEDADPVLQGMTELSAAMFIGEGYAASDKIIGEVISYFKYDFGASNHYDFEPAINAYRALGSAATPFLLEKLRIGRSVERGRAVWILGKNRDPSAVPALVSSLSDTSEGDWSRNCDAAAAALAEIGTEEAQRALLNWKKREPPGSPRR